MPEQSAWPDDSPAYPRAHGGRVEPPPISAHPEFRSLRHAHRRFGVRATVWSVGGFLLYVLLSSFTPGLMNQPLAGHLTLGLALGLGQFAVMAVTVWAYTRHMRTRVDPLARGVRAHLHQHPGRRDRTAAAHEADGQQPDQGPRGYRTW
ncbi:DUF485 domain-containing protein [Streptomyces sp. H51]|uniref:DUF485 domain-containing protein n=1 Tax=Streptomyces sp. H51 TaxID=3111770 RepID=UPI002D792371|nr:DUF485 domain-containing protein [Streptomyces sp. H51]